MATFVLVKVKLKSAIAVEPVTAMTLQQSIVSTMKPFCMIMNANVVLE
jgi:hypothetical protein